MSHEFLNSHVDRLKTYKFFVKLCLFAIDATSDDDKNVQNFCQKHVLNSMKKCHVLSH